MKARHRPTVEQAREQWRRGRPMHEAVAYARWRHKTLGEEPAAALDQATLRLDLQHGGPVSLGDWQ